MDLGETKNRVSLKTLLQRIVSGFNGTIAKELGVTLLLEADPVETDPDKAVFVTLSVNELILNALKYAFDGAGGTVRVLHSDYYPDQKSVPLSRKGKSEPCVLYQNQGPPSRFCLCRKVADDTIFP